MCKTRRLGDVAEATFLCRATEEGFRVARPFSDDSRYDAIVDNGRKRWLVQVKYAAQVCRPGVYVVRAARQEHSGNRRAPKTVEYLEGEIDFLAVFLAPEKRWYILPFSALRERKNLTLHANGGGVDGEYLESWDLLRG